MDASVLGLFGLGSGAQPHADGSLTAALVSRQFVDMSRVRIEGLLAAFPKLVGSGKQHTYVETENVRYVYQPMEVTSTTANLSDSSVTTVLVRA